MDSTNRQIRLAARPQGMIDDSIWEVVDDPVRAPDDGEVLVRNVCLSLDPAMRGWLNDVRSYVPPVGIGEVMRAGGIGRVVESRDQRFPEGAHVTGITGVQEYATLAGDGLRSVDLDVAPPERWLGALGMPGMTAYFGLLDVGEAREGDTVVVSGAAGDAQQDGVEDLAADVVEVDVDAVRRLLAQLGAQIRGLVVDRRVEAQLVGQPRALLGSARDADHTAALELRDLARGRTDRARRARDDDGVALARLAHVQQPEVRRHAGHAQRAEPALGRRDVEVDGAQAVARHRRVLLHAGDAGDVRALGEPLVA